MTSNPEITVEELKVRMDRGEDFILLDVREPVEFRICNLGGTLIPMGQLPARLKELDSSKEIAVLCHHGNRSRSATEFLLRSGFPRAVNVAGGIEAWAERIDPATPRY